MDVLPIATYASLKSHTKTHANVGHEDDDNNDNDDNDIDNDNDNDTLVGKEKDETLYNRKEGTLQHTCYSPCKITNIY